MHVIALSAENFRNLHQVFLEPHPRFNIFSGDNGQGKTNLLEAIYLLATLRSFRTSRIDELIQFGTTTATARARVERQKVERLLAVELSCDKLTRKLAQVDGKPARATEYFGGVNAVLFSPDDLRLPKGPPVMRRRFLDRAVWNTCPAYLKEVQTYERLLRSRNALLRPAAGTPPREDLLAVYDQQLCDAGAVLTHRRGAYVAALFPRVVSAFERVSRSGLKVELRYRAAGLKGTADHSDIPDASQESLARISATLLDRLGRDRRRDLLKGYTHSGPHADDVELELDGRQASLYASQGQTRALILALKIAEIAHLEDTLGDAPVLLLDDVSSELDPSRNAHLFDFLKQVPCQTFITTTSPEHIRLFEDRQDFQVIAGSIQTMIRGMI